MSLSLLKKSWRCVDTGAASGAVNMADDRAALDARNAGLRTEPRIRFFSWSEPTVTYGYLVQEDEARAWAKDQAPAAFAQRPTGGGVVRHEPGELSFSLLWPRGQEFFPDAPRACYEKLHSLFLAALSEPSLTLFLKPANSCAPSSASRVSACFEAPVCNDIMSGSKKILGGALRVTRNSILYQGTLHAAHVTSSDAARARFRDAVLERLPLPERP